MRWQASYYYMMSVDVIKIATDAKQIIKIFLIIFIVLDWDYYEERKKIKNRNTLENIIFIKNFLYWKSMKRFMITIIYILILLYEVYQSFHWYR